MPRISRSSGSKRRVQGPASVSSVGTPFSETPRILTSEEKRELILAHAAARAPRDPVQQASLFAGVMIAVLAIGAGWWATVRIQVQASVHGGSQSLRELTKELETFTEEAKTNPVVNPPELPGPTTAAQAAQFTKFLQAVLEGATGTPAERRGDLLAPEASTSVPSAEPDPSPETRPSGFPFVHPSSTGLTPDSSS
ncbi:hypothetical protein KJZ71_02105 [Patescibacteria group bacterium]|uniref:Transmembrane protein n=1 Tax=candidate division WWE3 bacterium TaxID=2053526 RepID=A0A928TQD7_UNCKA|nr:hypothetical protein [candidate division WWE3 bacterium]MCL4732580.1 hypothetical protein [Patescibacteria group bacterium]MDL1953231.1 hypothetical protein [Candidatus Uhrbacteria bacterium UHB]RIL00962.1 MAG: hypothetical protein DCC77_00255 [Candidatus Uhrbacteria bacterium]